MLKDEDDFYWLMMDYLQICQQQNILHTEIMVEPQTYFPQGVAIDTIMAGFEKAIAEANQQWGQSVLLILSFLRHLSEDEALETLKLAQPYRDQFAAIGLASSEIGNPPEKFTHLYQAAAEQGYHLGVHAGEEGPPDYIWQSIKELHATRIDHGVQSQHDPILMGMLKEHQTPLTVCPLSNVRLRVFDTMANHNLFALLDLGLNVSVNSDDPSYFGGYLNENYQALAEHLNMTKVQAGQLAVNSFRFKLA